MGDVDAFLDLDWSRRPHRLAARDVEGFADLLSLADVDHVLTTTAPRTPSFRLVKEGQPLPPSAYTRSGTVGGRPYQGAADVARVLSAFGEGATVVLQSLHRSWAPLARFCRDLELTLTHPVQANAYLTPAGATALAPHHDTHDVFVLQVHGHKHWQVSEPAMKAPLPRHRSRREQSAAQPVLFEADLSPGDCLYLPRGYVHAAAAQATVSLHITIGVHPVTLNEVLGAVLARTGEHPAFREALPVGFADHDGRTRLEGAIRACLAEAADWLETMEVEPIAETLQQDFWSQRLPLLDGQLLQLAELDRIGDASLICRRALSICEPSEPLADMAATAMSGGPRLRLMLGHRALEVPRTLAPALHRLLDEQTRTVADLDDLLDASSRLVLVRRLVREGILDVVGHG